MLLTAPNASALPRSASFLGVGQLDDGLAVRRRAPDDVVDAVAAQAAAVGQRDIAGAGAQVDAVAGLPARELLAGTALRRAHAGVAGRVLAVDDLGGRAGEGQRAAALIHRDGAVVHRQHAAAVQLGVAARRQRIHQAGVHVDVAASDAHVAGHDGGGHLGIGRRRAVAGHLGDLHLRARIGQLLAVEAQQVAVEGGIAAHDVDGHGQAHGRALGRHRARHRDGVQRRRIRGIDAHGLPREAGRLARLDGAVRDARLGGAPHHVDVDRAGQRELLDSAPAAPTDTISGEECADRSSLPCTSIALFSISALVRELNSLTLTEAPRPRIRPASPPRRRSRPPAYCSRWPLPSARWP